MTQPVASIADRALRLIGVAIVAAADRPALATTIPAATLATGALLDLGVIASDETPSATDQALALTKVEAVHAALVAQGLVGWADTAIPQTVAEEYQRLAALHLASAFGKSADPSILPMLEARVRRVALLIGAPDLAADAVMDVNRDLAARGLTRWSAFDIPDAVAAAYSVLAADALAPQFAQKTDPRNAQAARVAIARYVALPTSGEHVRAEYF